MWTFLLPDEITVTLSPELVSDGKRIVCGYAFDGQPLLDWIGKLIMGFMGDLDVKHVRVTPERIEISIPDMDLPYRLKALKTGDITIIIKKK